MVSDYSKGIITFLSHLMWEELLSLTRPTLILEKM